MNDKCKGLQKTLIKNSFGIKNSSNKWQHFVKQSHIFDTISTTFTTENYFNTLLVFDAIIKFTKRQWTVINAIELFKQTTFATIFLYNE